MEESIAFFMLSYTQDNKGYLGAILVTDNMGMPKEFRVTYPVKPTGLQVQLYGDSLLGHIGVNLCGKPLYDVLKIKPELLVVNNVKYLPLAIEVKSRVVYLERVGEGFIVQDGKSTKNGKAVKSSSERFQPLNVNLPLHYELTDQEEAMKLVSKYFQFIDLLEPFQRIQGALGALASQDEKFR